MISKQEIDRLTGKDATRLMEITRASDNTTLNLYDDFGGVILYNKMEGVDSIGESKNTYTEEYADAELLRVYMPDGDIYNKATVIKLTLDFVGENRSSVKDTFINFIKKGTFVFSDGVRERTFKFVYLKNSEPKEDIYKGSIHYMEVTFDLQNLSGNTTQTINIANLILDNTSSFPSNATSGQLLRKNDGYLYAYAYINSSTLRWVKMEDVDMTLASNQSTFNFNPYSTSFKYTSGGTTTKYSYAGGKLIKII